MELGNQFYKVAESGYSLTYATFYNPITKEKFEKRVWDMDDDRLLYDDEIQKLREMPINREAKLMWDHENGRFEIGDLVIVVRGRKVPKDTILKVIDIVKRPTYMNRQYSWCKDTEPWVVGEDMNGKKIYVKQEYCKYY